MSETDSIDAPVVGQPAGPGAVLRQAREERGLAVADVAASLKMSPRQIEAIESEDFARLSGTTFVRGFIRNYAKLLKLDAAPLLGALEAKTELAQPELTGLASSGVRMPSGAARQGKGSLVATLVALVLLGLALVLYFDAVDVGALLGPKGDAPRAGAPEPSLVQPTATVVPTPPADAAGAAQPALAADKAAGKPGGRQLVFSFDADSWVEVKDAGGRIVFSQLSRKGSTQVVEGRPPFEVVIGNAGQVRLQYDEQPVDLGPHTRVDVARLTLE